MARQAEAERERRAKVISAHGELEASTELRDAAQVLSEAPGSLQLRYLQTLLELGADQNSTVVFPLPMDVIGPVVGALGRMTADDATAQPTRHPTPGAADASPPAEPSRAGAGTAQKDQDHE